jgi:hypothetical protein
MHCNPVDFLKKSKKWFSYLNEYGDLGVHVRLKGTPDLLGSDGEDDGAVGVQLTLPVNVGLGVDGA